MLSWISQSLLGRFSRVTTQGRMYIPQLDGIRFIALLWVFGFHVAAYVLTKTGGVWDTTRTNPVIYTFWAGHVGVELFFMISGFILVLPFAKQHLLAGKQVGLGKYFARRLTRLEPPYMIHLSIIFIMWAVFSRHLHAAAPAEYPDWLGNLPKHLLASVFYSHHFVYGTKPWPNVVLWSLEIEVQFYIFAPLLAMVYTIGSRTLRRSILVAGIVVFSAISMRWHEVFLVSHSLIGYLHEFLTGFLLADLFLTDWKSDPPGSRLWDLLFVVGWAAILLSDFLEGYRVLAISWMMLLVYIGAFRGILARRLLSIPWVTTIGGMCCTVYMYHGWLIVVFGKKTWHWRTGVLWLDVLEQLALLIIPCLIVCALLFLVVERPFMKPDWPKRLRARVWPGCRPAEAPQLPKTETP
jgi:peptidoglycan/LPS O-acetylase OafA/YrhL